MNRRGFHRAMGAVVAGLAAGRAAMADQKKGTEKGGGKHSCKGKNACKGQGGCKSGDNGCAGKNSCKGKGGCASQMKKK